LSEVYEADDRSESDDASACADDAVVLSVFAAVDDAVDVDVFDVLDDEDVSDESASAVLVASVLVADVDVDVDLLPTFE
jgi:hypothetical protein